MATEVFSAETNDMFQKENICLFGLHGQTVAYATLRMHIRALFDLFSKLLMRVSSAACLFTSIYRFQLQMRTVSV